MQHRQGPGRPWIGRAETQEQIGDLEVVPRQQVSYRGIIVEELDTDAVLRRNPRGYFLMVEWDMHTNRLKRGLDRVVAMDAAVERTVATAGRWRCDLKYVRAADHTKITGTCDGKPVKWEE